MILWNLKEEVEIIWKFLLSTKLNQTVGNIIKQTKRKYSLYELIIKF